MTNWWTTHKVDDGWIVTHHNYPEEVYRFKTQSWAQLCCNHLNHLTGGRYYHKPELVYTGGLTLTPSYRWNWDVFGGGELVVNTIQVPSFRVKFLSWLMMGSKWKKL